MPSIIFGVYEKIKKAKCNINKEENDE